MISSYNITQLVLTWNTVLKTVSCCLNCNGVLVFWSPPFMKLAICNPVYHVYIMQVRPSWLSAQSRPLAWIPFWPAGFVAACRVGVAGKPLGLSVYATKYGELTYKWKSCCWGEKDLSLYSREFWWNSQCWLVKPTRGIIYSFFERTTGDVQMCPLFRGSIVWSCCG